LGQGETKLNGPDLTEGIPAESLADGQMLVGHARGKPVLLARVGQEIFAVSPHCTHYNGPLAEGLMVGDTVRCPWHHACFDLRTGEALRAPAVNPNHLLGSVGKWWLDQSRAEARTAPAQNPY